MQYALKGTVTPEMKLAAEYDQVEVNWLKDEIAAGRIIIPKNINHDFKPRAIGYKLTTKINANIGTSPAYCNLEYELEKQKVAIKYGTDSVMDLSTFGLLDKIRTNIIQNSPVMVGTVPIYAVMAKLLQAKTDFASMDPEMLFAEIEHQAKQGVDYMTLHCGVTRTSLAFLEKDPRICGVVSRGGSLLKNWMKKNNAENPLYAQYGRILDICEKYDITISLGDGLRPGAGDDATDRGQIAELLVLGELVDRARARGIQTMVEGPGHVPFDQIEMNIKLMKRFCHDAPFYVLGPLTTDIAPGYDHIVGAIGGTAAATYGADFLCYVTPAEHLTLPDKEDVRLGVIASKIAAHSGDIAKGIKNAAQKDYAMSVARRELDWEKMYQYALDPEYAKQRKSESPSAGKEHCSMCGELCAVKLDRDL